MKIAKRLFSLLMVTLMVVAMAVPGVAANDGSITITNPAEGQKYTLYKVFDATYSGKENVAYTYTKKSDSDAFFTALSENDSPFSLDGTTTTNVYNVTLKEQKSSNDISTWLPRLIFLCFAAVCARRRRPRRVLL